MRSRKLTEKALLYTVRITLYPVLVAVFFACLRIANPYLLAVNRTLATTLVAISAGLTVFSHVYGGFRAGELKISSVIANVWTSAFLSDCFAYLILEIMNVNARNRNRLNLGRDLPYLLLAVAAQFLVIALAAYLAEALCRRLYPPKKCCVVAPDEEALSQILPKLEKCASWFYAAECVTVGSEQMYAAVARNECCVLYHLPPALHLEMVEYCYRRDIPVYFDMQLSDIVLRDSESMFVDDVMMGRHTHTPLTLTQRFIKRAMDIAVSFAMLALTLPVMAVCACMIAGEDGSPVIFRQQRVTKGGRIFTIYKFRTMKKDGQSERSVTDGDDRITRVGRTLRRFRLDELPQLWNILKGDMSLVGPRPEMLSNVEEYTKELPEFRYRSKVKAGLTGYAQIMGKYNTPPREKLMMDMSYIDDYSLWMDIKLLAKTVLAVLRPEATEAFGAGPKDAGDGGKDGKDADKGDGTCG